MAEAEPKQASGSQETFSFQEFLEKVPPGRKVIVKDFFHHKNPQTITPAPKTTPIVYLRETRIGIYCDTCGGVRQFAPTQTGIAVAFDYLLDYQCCNCSEFIKRFALHVDEELVPKTVSQRCVQKYGEIPAFGPPTPARVHRLIGQTERDYYLKGRRAENQGLGIGAFAYYRRVVENSKDQILDKFIQVAKRLDASQEMIEGLEAAKTQNQFSQAVDDIKDGIPQALLINGQNPLKLLHSALSKGIHQQTDEDCIKKATSIRLVLLELTERIEQILKNDRDLNEAVNSLLNAKDKP